MNRNRKKGQAKTQGNRNMQRPGGTKTGKDPVVD
jgi:hypothetical protein